VVLQSRISIFLFKKKLNIFEIFISFSINWKAPYFFLNKIYNPPKSKVSLLNTTLETTSESSCCAAPPISNLSTRRRSPSDKDMFILVVRFPATDSMGGQRRRGRCESTASLSAWSLRRPSGQFNPFWFISWPTSPSHISYVMQRCIDECLVNNNIKM